MHTDEHGKEFKIQFLVFFNQCNSVLIRGKKFLGFLPF